MHTHKFFVRSLWAMFVCLENVNFHIHMTYTVKQWNISFFENEIKNNLKRQKLQAAHLTNAWCTIRPELKSLITAAHEGAIGVEAAMTARFLFTLVQICRNDRRYGIKCVSVCLFMTYFNMCFFLCVPIPSQVLPSRLRMKPLLQEQE